MQAWEEAGGHPAVQTRHDHIGLLSHPARQQFTFEVRRAARKRIEAAGSCAGVLDLEWRLRSDEASEPEGLC